MNSHKNNSCKHKRAGLAYEIRTLKHSEEDRELCVRTRNRSNRLYTTEVEQQIINTNQDLKYNKLKNAHIAPSTNRYTNHLLTDLLN